MALTPNEELFHQASKNGDLSQMKNILTKFINSKDEYGKTPIHNAADNGDSNMVDYLIVNGAEVNVPDQRGWTPIHFAVYEGHTEVAKCLIEKGATVDAITNGGATPLYVASQNGHNEVAKFLIENGATIDAKAQFDQRGSFTKLLRRS